MSRHVLRAAVIAALVVVGQAWLVAQKAQPAKADATSIVNLNTATLEQLDSLPGIGPKVAARIIEHRQKNGAFKKVEDLMNVKGIGEKAFLKIKSRLSVGAQAKPTGQNQQP